MTEVAELSEVTADSSVVEEKTSDCSSLPSVSSLAELEAKFASRYTEKDPGYATVVKGFDPVICVHPWADRPKRNFDHSSGRGGNNWRSGGWRGDRGRGGWRGRGDGGNYRGNWRGNNGGGRGWNDRKREHEGRGEGYGGGEKRVFYPGRD